MESERLAILMLKLHSIYKHFMAVAKRPPAKQNLKALSAVPDAGPEDLGDSDMRALFGARELSIQVLKEAYKDSTVPERSIELLAREDKPGKVLAIFCFGRSGSMFLQSFFDRKPYPRILTLPPDSLVDLETYKFPQSSLDSLNQVLEKTDRGTVTNQIVNWTTTEFQRCPQLFDDFDDYVELLDWRAPRDKFLALIQAQLAWLAPSPLTYNQLLRIIMLAHRLSRGQPVDFNDFDDVTYLWQAHVPLWNQVIQKTPRRHFLFKEITNLKTLTIVRFPEKSVDSHIIHHAFEFVQPPINTLVRRLLFEDFNYALAADLTNAAPAGSEVAVRFEDVHHHPAYVLQKICEWSGMQYESSMTKTDFILPVRGKKVTGARRLTVSEMRPKILSYFDVLKIRWLFEENYRMWGYGEMCDQELEKSLDEYQDLAKNIPFSCQALLTQMAGVSEEVSADESATLTKLFANERERRIKGVNIIPLLYNPEEITCPSHEEVSLNGFQNEGKPLASA